MLKDYYLRCIIKSKAKERRREVKGEGLNARHG
jgi:hypothetical protein